MTDIPWLRPKRGKVMPLVREENKKLVCLRCNKPKDEIRKYGWILCNECQDYIVLRTSARDLDIDAEYLKHKDHKKPCCEAKKDLEICGLI